MQSLTYQSSVTGSPEQDAIWAAIAGDTGHVVVKALAGTGKSFTCREAMKRTNRGLKVLYLAFNKVIADEFGRGAPTHCEVKTLNALGFRIVRGYIRSEIDSDKLYRIIEEVLPNTAQRRDVGSTVARLIGLCKGYLIDGSDLAQVMDLATRHEIELDSDAISAVTAVPEILKRCKTETGTIDFDDQVWLPVVLNMPFPKYDLVFVDEAQDLNPLQHEIVMRLLRPATGRAVVVGDDHQAIYGWRGSDVDSIDNLTRRLDLETGVGVTVLPLTVTRRCPVSVVRAAQEYVPALRALPDAPEGVVESIKDAKCLDQYRPGDMVVCRTNAPLLKVAYQLIRRGLKPIVRGRDIGQGLLSLIKVLRADSVGELLGKIDRWREREISKVEKTRRAETAIQRIQDRADCINELAEGCDTIQDLTRRIDSIFGNFEAGQEPAGAVVLSSVHRAKGLEAENLFWLYPDIKCMASQEWQKKQEINLRYVAVTRAKRRLVYVTR